MQEYSSQKTQITQKKNTAYARRFVGQAVTTLMQGALSV
jgi:hypothetical protein